MISSSGRPDLAEHAAGIVDQDVDRAGVRFDRGDSRLHRVAVADIDDMRAAAIAAQRAASRPARLR